MRRKVIPVLLALILMVGMIGCSTGNSGSSAEKSTTPKDVSAPNTSEGQTSGQVDFNEEPYTIKVNYTVLGQEQPDLPKIEERLNEITLKEINAKVDLEGVSLHNMANVYALKVSSGEKVDLMFLMPAFSYLAAFANNKMIRPIDEELAKWGSSLQQSLGEVLAAGQYNGIQYAIPQKQEQVLTAGFNMSKSILDKYNIDISAIKSLDDMDAIFATVHENEPNMTVLAPEVSASNIVFPLVCFDGMGNAYGVLMDGTGTKVTNLYESKEWVDAVKKVREWYLKGYISKDVSTSQDDGATLLTNGKVFATTMNSVNFTGGSSQQIETKTVALRPPVRITTDSQMFLWTIPSSSKRPDKAMQLLNLFYSNKELSTLLNYGIEGEHYEVNPDGTIDTSKNANYNIQFRMFGDVDKMPLSQALVGPSGLSSEAYLEERAKWNENATLSLGYGFVFDPTTVKSEIAALDAVSEQYWEIIGNGAVDQDEMIKKFNDDLYSAGLQKVMDEKQRQFDAWLVEGNQ
ncbi:ABC transporter substrate-binding protein [Paenibacillus albidus]|uniref:ABC transporter substrate-binding protein n=1 Tax=Paenibacillus albidus TaxID=2041023 RepID=UPI001BE6AF8A|nr:ABC transporter substrate-binding protein [Paenibacillus albidus]MBT2293143.1 ABC transporter substrate-binding protein [Paenibacillus albidus]